MAYCGCDPCANCREAYFESGKDEMLEECHVLLHAAVMPKMATDDFALLCNMVRDLRSKLAETENELYKARKVISSHGNDPNMLPGM
jgi:hypothetical protein